MADGGWWMVGVRGALRKGVIFDISKTSGVKIGYFVIGIVVVM